MTLVALKALWSRKLCTFLAGFAIVLGVATITGTFVLTDSIRHAFDSIFTTIYRGTDAVVTGKAAFDVSEDSGVEVPSFNQSLLGEVKALPTVAAAVGGVGGTAQLIDKDGDVIRFGGAPNIGFSVDPTQPRFNSIVLKSGTWPKATSRGASPKTPWRTPPSSSPRRTSTPSRRAPSPARSRPACWPTSA